MEKKQGFIKERWSERSTKHSLLSLGLILGAIATLGYEFVAGNVDLPALIEALQSGEPVSIDIRGFLLKIAGAVLLGGAGATNIASATSKDAKAGAEYESLIEKARVGDY